MLISISSPSNVGFSARRARVHMRAEGLSTSKLGLASVVRHRTPRSPPSFARSGARRRGSAQRMWTSTPPCGTLLKVGYMTPSTRESLAASRTSRLCTPLEGVRGGIRVRPVPLRANTRRGVRAWSAAGRRKPKAHSHARASPSRSSAGSASVWARSQY